MSRDRIGLRTDRHLSVAGLQTMISNGEIDTVLVCCTDLRGRLQGKRMHAAYFAEHVLEHGPEEVSYPLGDLELVPDTETLRLLPHRPATAMVQCDLALPDGSPVLQSPRTILRSQLTSASARGFKPMAGTEPEFMIFDQGYPEARRAGYRDLTPATGTVGPLLQEIRNTMYAAGMNVGSTSASEIPGQHRVDFRSADALTTADNHVVFKDVAREIAVQRGYSITFLATYNHVSSNACPIHLSLHDLDGRTKAHESFYAGILATVADLTLLYAPQVNSYKRFAATVPEVRMVGDGSASRLENCLPGGDVNPYLALAAMLAGGLYGVDHDLAMQPMPIVPRTLAAARAAFGESTIARDLFGDGVVDHYAGLADAELVAFNAAVTDWELLRGFDSA